MNFVPHYEESITFMDDSLFITETLLESMQLEGEKLYFTRRRCCTNYYMWQKRRKIYCNEYCWLLLANDHRRLLNIFLPGLNNILFYWIKGRLNQISASTSILDLDKQLWSYCGRAAARPAPLVPPPMQMTTNLPVGH